MSRRIARPYAAALFEVLERRDVAALRAIERGLESVAEGLHSTPELLRVFEVPRVPQAAKKSILDEIGRAFALAPEARRLLAALAQHYRLRYLADVVAAFRGLIDEREGVVRGKVTLPVTPKPEHIERLAAVLRQALGARVELEAEVRPEILAGFVVRLGSRVYDGSVRTQLKRFAESASGR